MEETKKSGQAPRTLAYTRVESACPSTIYLRVVQRSKEGRFSGANFEKSRGVDRKSKRKKKKIEKK